jgi:hypothetical protein
MEASDPSRVWLAVYDRTGALVQGCEVEKSLLYCTYENMDLDTGVALHRRNLLEPLLVARWWRHYERVHGVRREVVEVGGASNRVQSVRQLPAPSKKRTAGGEAAELVAAKRAAPAARDGRELARSIFRSSEVGGGLVMGGWMDYVCASPGSLST